MAKTFVKYPKIVKPNHKGTRRHLEALVEEEWVGTEKIHGANFSFNTDGQRVWCARRNGLIEEGESFNNYQDLFAKHKGEVLALFAKLPASARLLTVFGELFGGAYNHPQVPSQNVKAVCKGVQYTPGIEFMVFDVRILHEKGQFQPENPAGGNEGGSEGDSEGDCEDEDAKNPNVQLLNIDEIAKFLKYTTLMHVEPVVRGTLKDVLAFDVTTFRSTIPARLGLPPLASPNFAEGIVVRPVARPGVRIKIKHPNFTETATGVRPLVGDKERAALALAGVREETMRLLECYVTPNRLRNVLSKTGHIDGKQLPQLGNDLGDDALEEFVLDNEGSEHAAFKDCPEQEAALRHAIRRCAMTLVRAHARKILAGKF